MSDVLTAMASALGAPFESSDCRAIDQPRWFVGYTKPREEARAQKNLLCQGFECHVPLIRTQKRSKGMLAWRLAPLFPRYLFLRPASDAAQIDRVRSTLGMTGLVRFAGYPATVAHAVIEELKALGEDFRLALFKAGDSVKLANGLLAGLEGILERAEGMRG